jgi:hypothetical protein
MPSAPFPTRAFRRTREKASPYLFAFSADDFSLIAPTGQTLVHTRSSGRTVLDSGGRVVTLATQQPSWAAVYNATTGNQEPVWHSDRACTNLVLRSEDYSTTWSAVGSPTRTAAAKYTGDVALDLIGDDAAGTLEGYTQTVTFTTNAVKAVSVFVAKGTSTSSAIRLRDTSAAANRLLAVVTWSGTVPSVAMTTGTLVGSVPCANGVYRLLFQTTSVTAANTNSLEVYPATDSALAVSGTGTLYAGGAQAENYDYPRPYVKSLGSQGGASGDTLSATLAWLPQDFTVYARVLRPCWAGVTTPSGFIAGIASQWHTSGSRWGLRFGGVSGDVQAMLDDGTTTVTASASIPAGGALDLCAQFSGVTTAGTVRLDVGAGFGSTSSAVTAIAAWGNPTLFVGSWSSNAENMDAGLRRLIVAPGARTLASLRGVLD